MIRVLHAGCPDEASRRFEFLGISRGDRENLLRELRHFILNVPDGNLSGDMASSLSGRGVPCGRGKKSLAFSVSSAVQVEIWLEEEPAGKVFLYPVLEAIRRFQAKDFKVSCRGRMLELVGSPKIMGILNVTPDSFSDGGAFLSIESAVRKGIELAEGGADIIDVGGESTRPGSRPVREDEEMARVIPVIRALSERTEAILSVDTTKAGVAREAAAAGAGVINDTSALGDDPGMADVVKESGCAVVLMHRRGKPATMQAAPGYASLFDEILDELSEKMDAAVKSGVSRESIIVDPGVGFGKRQEDNLALHRYLADLRNLGRPILFGPSRKSFIGAITGKGPGERVFGTAGAVALAAAAGADIIRVHDVKEMKEVARVVTAVREGAEC